ERPLDEAVLTEVVTEVAEPSPEPSSAGKETVAKWYYTNDGQRFGPVSLARLEELARTGSLAADDLEPVAKLTVFAFAWHDCSWCLRETLRGGLPHGSTDFA